MKKIYFLFVIICTFLLIVGCSQKDDKTSSSEEKILTYGSSDFTRINPAIDEHGEINSLLFDGLVDRNAQNELVPGLATSWDYDEATSTYTFHLRDAKWHDGEDFTAEDVAFTLEAIMNPANESEIASNYEDIKDIKIIDSQTIAITLKDTNAAFLDYMTIAILPKHLLEGEDMQESKYFKFPIGTGPYKIQEWDEGQSVVLVKNDEYFKGAPKIDKVVFKITADDNVQALQLKSGELDLALLPPTLINQFKKDDQFKVYTLETADYRGIMYNFNSPFWKENSNLIKAFNYAFNREVMVDTVLLGQGEVAYGPLQKNKFNSDNVEKYNYNPEKAKELIEAEGWTIGKDGIYEKAGKPLRFELSVRENEQERLDLAKIAAQQLKEIDVDCEVKVTANIDWVNQDAFLIGWGSPFDADDHTYKVFGTNKGSNFNFYSNLEVDKYLTLARQTTDEKERAAYYEKFQQVLAQNPPYSFFVYLDANYVAKKSISGISKNTILGHHGVGIFWNIEEWDIQ